MDPVVLHIKAQLDGEELATNESGSLEEQREGDEAHRGVL